MAKTYMLAPEHIESLYMIPSDEVTETSTEGATAAFIMEQLKAGDFSIPIVQAVVDAGKKHGMGVPDLIRAYAQYLLALKTRPPIACFIR